MPAEFTKTDVEHVATLARLALSEDEKTRFGRQLARILDYASELQRVDTTGVDATSHASVLATPERPDEPAPTLPRAEALENAPEPAPAEGLFKVPRVLGG